MSGRRNGMPRAPRPVLTLSAALCGLMLLAGPARADAPMIECHGQSCGGEHGTCYAYKVDAASYPVMHFEVGTNDLKVENYTNVQTPRGWQFTVEERGMGHDHGGFTMHERVSPGPCRCLTQGRVRWWTDDPENAVEAFTFAFDHPWRPEDVGWELLCYREGPPPETYRFHEFWDAKVGVGNGPLHGPSVAYEDELRISRAKCKVKGGKVKKVNVNVKNAGYMAEHLCRLDSGQELITRSTPSGKIRFLFKGPDAPPCGENGATVDGVYRPFTCGC